MDYYVIMIDYGRRGREAIVDPEMTRSNVIDRIKSGEYSNIAFIHHIVMGELPADVTNELLAEAGFYLREMPEVDRMAATWDHVRDLRKNFEQAAE